jgi:hypothetical protein
MCLWVYMLLDRRFQEVDLPCGGRGRYAVVSGRSSSLVSNLLAIALVTLPKKRGLRSPNISTSRSHSQNT